MMSKVLILFKKDILSVFNYIGLNKDSNDYKEKMLIFSIIVSSVSFFVMYWLFGTYSSLFRYGYELIGVSFGKKLAFGLLFLVNIYFLYELVESREYLLLNSLPISKKSIIGSKLLMLYLFDYLIEMIVFLPLGIITGYNYLLIDIAVYFFVIPPIVSFICSFLVFSLVMVEKIVKVNIITKTFCLFVTISIAVILLISNKIDLKYTNMIFRFLEVVSYKISTYILYIAIAILSGYLVTKILNISIESNFNRDNTVLLRKCDYQYHQKKKYEAIFTTELKQYASLLPYVLNTALGLILIMFFSMNFYLFKKGFGINLLGIPHGMVKNSVCVLPYVMSLVVGVCCTTQVSLSLEGKCIWIKKMIPIPDRAVYQSKIMVGLMLMIPVAIISSVLILRPEGVAEKEILMIVMVIMLNLLLMALVGILINIKFVNYDWNNSISVMKRSSTAIIYQILNILMNTIFILLIVIFKQSIAIRIICVGITIVLVRYIYKFIMEQAIPD